jgi:DNA-binding PadR family transcriptional regulator
MKETEDKARTYLPLTEATFLVLVSLIEPKHGYGIMQTAALVSGQKAKLGPGTLYGALTNMLKQGLIERKGEQDLEGERRKVYALTDLGRAVIIMESERLEMLAGIGREARNRLRATAKES